MCMYQKSYIFLFCKLFVNIEILYKCDAPVDGIVVSQNSAEYKLVYRLINLLSISLTYFMELYRGSLLHIQSVWPYYIKHILLKLQGVCLLLNHSKNTEPIKLKFLSNLADILEIDTLYAYCRLDCIRRFNMATVRMTALLLESLGSCKVYKISSLYHGNKI